MSHRTNLLAHHLVRHFHQMAASEHVDRISRADGVTASSPTTSTNISISTYLAIPICYSRDIFFGGCQFVCLNLYVWFISRYSGKQERVAYKSQVSTFIMYQLVSMNWNVKVKNIKSSTYESIVVNLYIIDTKPIVQVGKS